MAENKGLFKTPLHKIAWDALNDEQKYKAIQDPLMYGNLAVRYNVKKKAFSVDVD
jgi:hypothetical protein